MSSLTVHWRVATLFAGGDEPRRVDPDRPTVSQTTRIVAPRAIQIELGVDAQVHGLTREDTFPAPMLIRIGLHENIELRPFDGAPWHWLRSQLGSRQRGEISLGARSECFERGEKTRTSLGP